MDYYIEAPVLHGKAQYLAQAYDAELLDAAPASYDAIPETKGLVVVVDNGIFEAAVFCYSEAEFAAFTASDPRPRTFVLMDRKVAEVASGFNREPGSFPDYSVKDPEVVKKQASA